MVPKLTPWEVPVREGGCEEHSQRTVPRVSVARGSHSLGLICDMGLGKCTEIPGCGEQAISKQLKSAYLGCAQTVRL